MKKLLILIFCLITVLVSKAQPSAGTYTHIAGGMNVDRAYFKALNLPAGGSPSLQTRQWTGSGAIWIDTVAHKIKIYDGGVWYEYDYVNGGGTQDLQSVTGYGATTTDTIQVPGINFYDAVSMSYGHLYVQDNNIYYKTTDGYISNMDFSSNTASRGYTFPDESGTVLLHVDTSGMLSNYLVNGYNGLTKSSKFLKLGGTISENTLFDGRGYKVNFNVDSLLITDSLKIYHKNGTEAVIRAYGGKTLELVGGTSGLFTGLQLWAYNTSSRIDISDSSGFNILRFVSSGNSTVFEIRTDYFDAKDISVFQSKTSAIPIGMFGYGANYGMTFYEDSTTMKITDGSGSNSSDKVLVGRLGSNGEYKLFLRDQIDISGGGGTQDLQSVTDEGQVTTNNIELEGSTLIVRDASAPSSYYGTVGTNTSGFGFSGPNTYIRNNYWSTELQLGDNTAVIRAATVLAFDKASGTNWAVFNFSRPKTSTGTNNIWYLPDSSGTVALTEYTITPQQLDDSTAAIRADFPTGGGSPGGSNKQIQYNNSSAFAGGAGFEYGNTNNTVLIQSQNAADVPLIIQAAASQTAAGFLYKNSSGTSLFEINRTGRVVIGDGYSTAAATDGLTLYYHTGNQQSTVASQTAGGTSKNLILSSNGIYFSSNTANWHFMNVNGMTLGSIAAPTARLMLAAGTTSLASLRIQDGVAPTSPNEGDIWNLTTQYKLQYRSNGTTRTFANTDEAQDLTNKRIVPTSSVTTSASSLTPNFTTYRIYGYSALAANITFNAPTGTYSEGDWGEIWLEDNATSRTITWNSAYVAAGVTLPSSTTAGKKIKFYMEYNGSEWLVTGVSEEN